MSSYLGFDADVRMINDMATKDLPDVSTSIKNQAQSIRSLEMSDAGVFFSNNTAHTDLGAKYNAIVQQLSDGLTALATSFDTAAQRLKAVADNYERIDQSLAGQ